MTSSDSRTTRPSNLNPNSGVDQGKNSRNSKVATVICRLEDTIEILEVDIDEMEAFVAQPNFMVVNALSTADFESRIRHVEFDSSLGKSRQISFPLFSLKPHTPSQKNVWLSSRIRYIFQI
jgi:hypothetical protein